MREKCSYFPTFGLNTQRYGVSLRTDNFYAAIRLKKTLILVCVFTFIIFKVNTLKIVGFVKLNPDPYEILKSN